MYICSCNAITDKQVIQAIHHGCQNPLDIYVACDTRPQCGRCMDRMWEMLKTSLPTLHESCMKAE